MSIGQISDRKWYLAQHINAAKKREALFAWLGELQITSWTPQMHSKVRRTDAIMSFRHRITPVFPGYFFLKADFNKYPIDVIRSHSAFIDFVKYGGTIRPVDGRIVDSLMEIYPEHALAPGARETFDPVSQEWLTKVQYQYLLRLENNPVPESRIAMLLDLVLRSQSA